MQFKMGDEIDFFKKKEKEYETILERVTDSFVALDENGIFTYVNKKAGEIFGRKSERLIGKHIWTEFLEGKNQPIYNAYHKAMETQQYQYLQAYYQPYGKWFVNHLYPSPDGLTIYFEDITLQKEQEQALNSYKEELEKKVKERTNELELQNVIINKQKEEIEVLIKELHHRVKNNMQIISSLLSLQSNMVEDSKIQEMFNDCKNRVYTMALIHEKMYQSNNLTRINAKDYLTELIKDIIKSSSLEKEIDLDLNIDPIEFGTKMMVPIGLLVNEIVLNSIKHAFHSVDKGEIIFQFHKTQNDICKITIGDNGCGINKEEPFRSGSLGMDIIEAFVSQLDGTLKISEGPGTVYEIEFKITE